MIENFQYEMTYEDINIHSSNIEKYISTVKYVTNNINYISFDNMTSVFDDYAQTLYVFSNKSFENLLKDKIDGIKYYQDKNLLVIPTIIDDTLYQNSNNSYEALISFYNINESNIWKYNSYRILNDSFPVINSLKLAKVKRKYYSNIDAAVLFDNLPQHLYKNVIIEEQGIIYNVDTNEYFTEFMNQEELFNKIKEISNNGFLKPINMLITDEGLLPLNDGKIDFLIALYLNLPSIPVAFISSADITFNYIIKKIENKDKNNLKSFIIKKCDNDYNKSDLEKILNPYIIIN